MLQHFVECHDVEAGDRRDLHEVALQHVDANMLAHVPSSARRSGSLRYSASPRA